MDILTHSFQSQRRRKMLGRAVQDICETVVSGKERIDVGKYDDDSKQRKHEDIDFLLKEHSENRTPVGIAGSGDFFRFKVVVRHRRKKLLLGKTQIVQSNKLLRIGIVELILHHALPRFAVE